MPSYTLIIGNKNYSSWSLRPWLWMKHVGIAFEERRVALFVEDTDERLAPYFSNLKVPVLLDDDLIVWDSLSILEYLADRHPEKNGWPGDRRARATARSMGAEMHSSFIALRSELPMNCRKRLDSFPISPEVGKDVERILALWGYCRDRFGHDGPWLFGEFRIADAMFAPVALRFYGYKVPLDDVGDAYVQAVCAHPFVADWIESGKAEQAVIEASEVEA
jgi:glutathione S-transferase